MTKQELLNAIAAKKGFHSLISDDLAPDNVPNDPIEKRQIYLNHTNADGTMGKTFVFYLYDKANDVANFYNVEPENVDNKEPSAQGKVQIALQNYLGAKYAAYFIGRIDYENKWAEADVFVLNAGTLTRKSVLVFKKGANPINDIDVTIA